MGADGSVAKGHTVSPLCEGSPTHMRKTSCRTFVPFTVVLLLAPLVSIHGADKVYVNGEVVVMDERGTVTEAVRVGENGRIVAVGKRADVAKAAGTPAQVIDLRGRTLLPGFYAAHDHF